MNKRLHVFISGNVQGVGLRYFLRNKAMRMGINGFVRNLQDGRVEAVFEGNDEGLQKVIEFCKRGTFISKVKNLDVKEESFRNEFREFEIRE